MIVFSFFPLLYQLMRNMTFSIRWLCLLGSFPSFFPPPFFLPLFLSNIVLCFIPSCPVLFFLFRIVLYCIVLCCHCLLLLISFHYCKNCSHIYCWPIHYFAFSLFYFLWGLRIQVYFSRLHHFPHCFKNLALAPNYHLLFCYTQCMV